MINIGAGKTERCEGVVSELTAPFLFGGTGKADVFKGGCMLYIQITGSDGYDVTKIALAENDLNPNLTLDFAKGVSFKFGERVRKTCCPDVKLYEVYKFDSDEQAQGMLELIQSTLKRMRYYPIKDAGQDWFRISKTEAIKVVVQCIETADLDVEGRTAREKRVRREDDIAREVILKQRNQLIENRLNKLEGMVRWKPDQTNKYICQAGSYSDHEWNKYVPKWIEVRKKEIIIEQKEADAERREYRLAQERQELVARYNADSAGIAEGLGVFFGILLFLGLIWAVVAAVVSVTQ